MFNACLRSEILGKVRKEEAKVTSKIRKNDLICKMRKQANFYNQYGCISVRKSFI
jgi:hypothetical protein